jgi:mannose-6-phosphate isomerase-like protein (cupin superfamily)
MDKIKITEPNTGKHIAIAGDINSILASKDDTGGTYSIIEIKVFPNGGPIPHIQTREHEGFYVLEGEISFSVNGKESIAKRGTFVNIPPHVIHSFKNKTEVLAKMLVILAPGRLENLFVQVGYEVSDPTLQPPPMSEDKMEKFASLLSDYGVEIKH